MALSLGSSGTVRNTANPAVFGNVASKARADNWPPLTTHIPLSTAQAEIVTANDADLLCALSAMQIRFGKAHEAVSYLLAVRRHRPTHTQAIRLLAVSLMKLQRWEEARQMLDELDAIKPNGPPLIALYRAIIEFRQNQLGAAKQWFARFLGSEGAHNAPHS